MTTLVEKVLALSEALTAAGVDHAFGGAIALAYCTEDPRGTRDVDVNAFAPASEPRLDQVVFGDSYQRRHRHPPRRGVPDR